MQQPFLKSCLIHKVRIQTPEQIFANPELSIPIVFLDIKCPGYGLDKAVGDAFLRFAKNEKLPVTRRSSFGFATTNFTLIPTHDGQNKIRINPGLEGDKEIARYAAFFQLIQGEVDKVIAENPNLPKNEIGYKIALALLKAIP